MALSVLYHRQTACVRHLWLCQASLNGCLGVKSRLNHYNVLGVKQDATRKEIRAAFLKRSKECHPDVRNMKSDHEKFVKVNEAYTVLSKTTSRKDYDIKLASGRASAFDPQPFRTHHQSHQQAQYYQHPDWFYDQQMHSRRDQTQEKYYQDQRFHGVKGASKISNTQIVAGCVVFMLGGIVLHTVVVSRSSDKHLKVLEDRDMKIHAMWTDAVSHANKYTKEEHLEILKDYQEAVKSAKAQK